MQFDEDDRLDLQRAIARIRELNRQVAELEEEQRRLQLLLGELMEKAEKAEMAASMRHPPR